jgi:hypothetical protein
VRSIYTADGENLYRPVGLGAADNGDFVITLRDSQKVVLFDSQGDWVRTWGERGLAPGNMIAPVGAAWDRATNHIYVTDRSRLRLITYSPEGRLLFEIPILNPLTPAVSPDGVLVTTFGPLVQMSPQGETLTELGVRGLAEGEFDYPRGAVSLGGKDFAIADTNNARVQRITMSGEVTPTVKWVDGEPPQRQDDPNTRYGVPSSVAVDDEGLLYVLDGFRHAIVVLDAETGEEVTSYSDLDGERDGRFNLPTAIAYLGGDTFAITDTYNDRVQIVRILLPEENNIIARSPWILWLLLLLLIPPLFLIFGRKRFYATAEAMERARRDERLRLVAAVGRKVHVNPEVAQALADAVEVDVAIAPYLIAVGETGDPSSANERLLAALPTLLQRLVLPRVRIVAASAEEGEALRGRGRKLILLDELAAEYQLEGEGTKGS